MSDNSPTDLHLPLIVLEAEALNAGKYPTTLLSAKKHYFAAARVAELV